MNKTRHYLVALFLIGLIYISCENKIAVPPAPASIKKPQIVYGPPTIGFNGYNYLSSYASGGSITYKNNILVVSLENTIDGNFGMNAFWTIQFYAKETGIYVLSNKNKGSYTTWDEFENTYTYGDYYTDSIHIGKVNLAVLDTINHVASGTFWYACEMQAPNINGGLDSVTNGFFTNMSW